MRIVFDQGTPVPLRQSLKHHIVATAHEREWSRLKNGELLDAAEKEGFEVFVTTDVGAIDATAKGSYVEVEIP